MQILDILVADQRLIQGRFALNDIDEIVDDAAFAAHNEVEVTKTDVEVDHNDLLTAQGESGRQVGRRSGFTHATLAGGDDDDSTHDADTFSEWLNKKWVNGDTSIGVRSFKSDGFQARRHSPLPARSGRVCPAGFRGHPLQTFCRGQRPPQSRRAGRA